MMVWVHFVAYGFGGLFLINAVPHLVSGVMGRPFQSPFAKPRGEGYSSSTLNVVWGALNAAIGYLLLVHVGAFDLRRPEHVAAAAIPAFLGALFLARRFGQHNGGNSPLEAQAERDAAGP